MAVPCKPRAGSCDLSRDPARPASPWCHWHRLSYGSRDAQAVMAGKRIAGERPQDPGPGAATCSGCGPVPAWYLKAGLCTGCREIKTRDRRAQTVYGLAPGDFERLRSAQGGRCAICRSAPRGNRPLVVDHNHQTGVVRGLLCDRCNHDLLGAAHDGPRLLSRALRYVLGDDMSDEGPEMPQLVALLQKLV